MTTDLSTLPNLDYFRVLHSCLRHNDTDAEAERARAFLQELGLLGTKVAPVVNEAQRTLLALILKYFRDSQESPTLARFIEIVENLDKKAGPLQMIEEYKALLTGFTAHTVRELPSLIDAMACVYRDHFASSILSVARQAITGIDVHDNGKPKSLKGWQDAFTFLRSEMARPAFRIGASLPRGEWQENAIARGETFLDRLANLSKTRCYTGFRAIDDAVVIGPQETNRYIGVLAASNHGKSTYLTTLAYNLSLQGKKVLFVPLEDGVEGTWDSLTFLHAYYRDDLDIPPMWQWQQSFASITDRQKDDLRTLAASVKDEMRGKLDVQQITRWPDIYEYLESAAEPFDVCIVDSFGDLDTGAVGDKEQTEFRSIFKQGQLLTQIYKGGRGLVLITGLQANRKGIEAAAANEGDPGIYPDMSSIEYFSKAAQSMRLILTVWGGDDFRALSQLKVGCLKIKGSKVVPSHLLTIDPRTRMLTDYNPGARPGAEKRDGAWKDDSMPRDFAFENISDLRM